MIQIERKVIPEREVTGEESRRIVDARRFLVDAMREIGRNDGLARGWIMEAYEMLGGGRQAP